MPLTTKRADNHPNRFSFSTRDYLELVDWAGRAVRDDKRGAIPSSNPPILQRLGLRAERYLEHVQGKGRGEAPVMLGHVKRMRAVAEQLGRTFLKGMDQSKMLYV